MAVRRVPLVSMENREFPLSPDPGTSEKISVELASGSVALNSLIIVPIPWFSGMVRVDVLFKS